jgi:hypothetical protein
MQEERFGQRDISYSAWHRTASLRRYLGEDLAATLKCCDLDHSIWIEHADGTKEPILLIETAMDVGQDWKATTVLRQLAKRANLPAYCVLYSRSNASNEGDVRFADIDSFRVRRVWPDPDSDWTELSPQQWAERLLIIRARGAAKLDRETKTGVIEPLKLGLKPYIPGTQ